MTYTQGKENILVLAKTYPNPSAKYLETSCIAGITDKGEMRRIYPVPFRRIDEETQFRKWQWIEVETEKNNQDRREESRKIHFDKIKPGSLIDTSNCWSKRISWINKIPKISYFASTGTTPEISKNISLAVYTPQSSVTLEIKKSSNEWTEEQSKKLQQFEGKELLFSEEANLPSKTLEKIPYDFYYSFEAITATNEKRRVRIKIIDWEVCGLFRNCFKDKDTWQEKMRSKLETKFNHCNLKLLLGNQHRFPHQWMIVSLIYPPKQSKFSELQSSLFLDH